MSANLILIRGIPGSGKSTLARKLTEEMGVWAYEADRFFENYEGEYKFDPKALGAAHDYCFGSVMQHLYHHHSVIVSNCFSTDWEVERYLKGAQTFGAATQIIHCVGEYGSIHNVPAEKMEQIKARFWSNEDLFNKFGDKYPNVSYLQFP